MNILKFLKLIILINKKILSTNITQLPLEPSAKRFCLRGCFAQLWDWPSPFQGPSGASFSGKRRVYLRICPDLPWPPLSQAATLSCPGLYCCRCSGKLFLRPALSSPLRHSCGEALAWAASAQQLQPL